MYKKILSAAIIYSLLTFLQPIVNLGIQPILLRYLSEVDIAKYNLMNNFATLISLLVAFNISSSIVSFFPMYAHSTLRIDRFVGQIVGFTLRSAFILLVIMVLLGPYLFAWKFGNNNMPFYPLGFIATLSGIGLAIYTPYLVHINMTHAIKQYAFLTLLNVIGGTLLQLLFIAVLLEGALGALLGRLLGIGFPILYLMLKKRPFWSQKIDFRYLKKPLLFARYTLLNTCFYWIASVGDRFMIEHFLGLSSVAAYSLLNILIGSSEMGFNALRTAILPNLYKSFEQPQEHISPIDQTVDVAQIKQNNLYAFYMAGSMMGVSVVAFWGSHIDWLTQKTVYLQLQPHSCLYAAGFATVSVTLLIYTRYYYMKNSLAIMYYSFFSALCLLILDALLLPLVGIKGAIWAMVASQWATLLILCASSTEARRIMGNRNVALPLFFTLFILLLSTYLIQHPIPIKFIQKNISTIQCIIVFLFLCLLNQKSVLILLKTYLNRFFSK